VIAWPTLPISHLTNTDVGWLSSARDYYQQPPDEQLVRVLRRLVLSPVNLYRGSHLCEFCPQPTPILSKGGILVIDPPRNMTGNGEIRVEGKYGKIYVAPMLILHYVVEHSYAPPLEFVDAVLRLT
jgi:hypothetical protein